MILLVYYHQGGQLRVLEGIRGGKDLGFALGAGAFGKERDGFNKRGGGPTSPTRGLLLRLL